MADKKPKIEEGHEGHDHAVSHAKIVLKPRITEKASMHAQLDRPVFTFEIDPAMTKGSVAALVKKEYKVTPIKVHMVSLPRKRVFVRGKWGMKSGTKKALVYLKKGDTIDLSKAV